MKKTKTLSRKELIQRLDRLRQTCARYEGAKKKDGEYVSKCVTCGAIRPCSKMNGGHFIPRSCMPFRWDEKNVHPQCPYCNLYMNGAYIAYSQWFIKQYGQEEFDRYVDKFKLWRSGQIPAYKMSELREIYNEWLKEGRKLEEKVGELFPKTWSSFPPDFLE